MQEQQERWHTSRKTKIRERDAMSIYDLYAYQKDKERIEFLIAELEELMDFNPYRGGGVSDMPKSGGGELTYPERMVEQKMKLERMIRDVVNKANADKRRIEEYAERAPEPERTIIRCRAIDGMSWNEIGLLVRMSRRTVNRRFNQYATNFPLAPKP